MQEFAMPIITIILSALFSLFSARYGAKVNSRHNKELEAVKLNAKQRQTALQALSERIVNFINPYEYPQEVNYNIEVLFGFGADLKNLLNIHGAYLTAKEHRFLAGFAYAATSFSEHFAVGMMQYSIEQDISSENRLGYSLRDKIHCFFVEFSEKCNEILKDGLQNLSSFDISATHDANAKASEDYCHWKSPFDRNIDALSAEIYKLKQEVCDKYGVAYTQDLTTQGFILNAVYKHPDATSNG